MKIIDLHLDIADIYKTFKYSVDDFYNPESDAPITLKKLQDAGISIIGPTLYFDKGFIASSFYDGVKEYFRFYSELFSRSNAFYSIKSSSDLMHENNGRGRIGFIYTIEGFDCLRTPDDVDEMYDLGVRCFGPTWNNDNLYASGRLSKNDAGITTQGNEVLRKLNNHKKAILDISHLSYNSIKDADKMFNGIIIATHSNAAGIYNWSRKNLSDDEIQIVVDRGGAVGLFPLVASIGGQGTFEDLYRHLDYIAGKWGINYVGFTSDIYPLPEYPFANGYKDVLIMKELQKFLLTKLSVPDVQRVMHDNWLRVLRQAL